MNVTCVGVDAGSQVEVEPRSHAVRMNAKLVEVMLAHGAGQGRHRRLPSRRPALPLTLVHHVPEGKKYVTHVIITKRNRGIRVR